MALGCYQELRPKQSMEQTQMIYQAVEDLDLFSLHRIRARIGTLNVHPTTRDSLVVNMLNENRKYREEEKCKKFCLTIGGADRSIDTTLGFLEKQANIGLSTLDNSQRPVYMEVVQRAIDTQKTKMRTWFADNYDDILYDQSGKIPLPVILALRKSFRSWAISQTTPFQQPIEEFLDGVASEQGLNPKDFTSAEEIWNKLNELRRE